MRRWCKNCRKIVYSDLCPSCNAKTDETVPIEVLWCPVCNIPYIADTGTRDCACPLCGSRMQYLSKDLRPVFPEERLLVECIEDKPLSLLGHSVWADGSRYYIDGRTTSITIERLKKMDADEVRRRIDTYAPENNYESFDRYISAFTAANRDRLALMEEEAMSFVREQVRLFPKHQLVISFSGGKDSTAVASIVTRALADPSIVHVFGDTTLEFPSTYEYIARFRKENPLAIVKTARNREQEFYAVCDEIGPPARMMRWCCTMFKTGPITRVFNSLFRDENILTFYGIRRFESTSRSKYDRVANGANVKIQKQTVAAPIFNWNDLDVWLYLLAKNVDFNDAYRLGYDRVGCWCCPNNTIRAQFLSKIYMPDQSEKWRNYLIDFAKKIGKPDPEVYVDDGKWKARQGGNGLAAAEDVKIRYTNCTAEDHAKIYRLNRPVTDDFFNLFVPFGKVSKELGRKLLNEVLVLDIRTNVPVLSVQPFEQDGYEHAVKVRTMNVADHDGLQGKVAYQIRKFNACRKCLKCESVCPYGAISVTAFRYKIDDSKCRHCLKCVSNKYINGGCLMEHFLKSKEEYVNEN